MVVYVEGMGPLKYKNLDLGYIKPDDIILEYEDNKFKKRYHNYLQDYSKDIKSAESLVRRVGNNFITKTLCKFGILKNKTAKYKAAQKILQYEVIKDINILDYIANKEKYSREIVKQITEESKLPWIRKQESFRNL